MKIKLQILNIIILREILNRNKSDSFPVSIQYADFNVLNYLYENRSSENKLNGLILYPDSTAVHIYLKLFKKTEIERIISTDLQNQFLNEINNKKNCIYLLGDSNLVLQRTVRNLNDKYVNINIKGYSNGYNFNTDDIVKEINNLDIDVLFVGLGSGLQEKWLLENYKKLNVKIIINVGGWFQYLSENKKRAPILLRKFYLEWLYKLVVEFPRIWKRYLVGIPKFYFRVITKKMVINLEY